jgi:hypothetical protein
MRRPRAPFSVSAIARPLPPALVAAYEATAYMVDGRADWTLRIGAACPALSSELARQGLDGAAYVSAWNPAGRRAPAVANAAAHALLQARVEAMKLRAFPGWGRGDAGDWPPERSLLILGLAGDAARALACDFGQRACVVLSTGGAARILPTRA